MATITIDLEPGEEVMLQVMSVTAEWLEGPPPGEEAPEEEEEDFVDATGTGKDRIHVIKAVA
jgi:hypothetical protein